MALGLLYSVQGIRKMLLKCETGNSTRQEEILLTSDYIDLTTVPLEIERNPEHPHPHKTIQTAQLQKG